MLALLVVDPMVVGIDVDRLLFDGTKKRDYDITMISFHLLPELFE
jgi:hypothetical protein